ncbi:uncharacterized protein PRCAT00000527001 [Priceomyces carsonii]|uniref:uncharacterized protein n=1 Tax=Priceomyces carsonii TaxID=28549 RepID=UPI002ED829BB|nr:unnamed protein product [Priceomyces carsonii]
MAAFPKLPLVNGDTDEDASIHLNATVGPSKPLRSNRTSKEDDILKILNATESTDEKKLKSNEFNKYFKEFQETGHIEGIGEEDEDEDDNNVENINDDEEKDEDYELSFDDESDETEVEDEEIEPSDGEENRHFSSSFSRNNFHREKPNRMLFDEIKKVRENESPFVDETTSKNSKGTRAAYLIVLALVSFFGTLGFALYFDALRSEFNNTPTSRIENFSQLASKFNKIDSRLNLLDDFSSTLSKRQDFLQQTVDSLSNGLMDKFDAIANRFNDIEKNMIDGKQFKSLSEEFKSLKENVKSKALETNPEPVLIEITEKLEKLSQLHQNLEDIQDNVLDSLKSSLPSLLPVFVKDNKIHFLPEFHKYLYNFMESFHNDHNTTLDWDKFIQMNEPKLSEYLNSAVNRHSNLKYITKEAFEKTLNQKLKENNGVIWKKFNDLVDNINLVNSSSSSEDRFVDSSHKVYLNSILELFTKDFLKVNYADYSLGARILGFLTTSKNSGSKSLFRKLLFGWYDYLIASEVSAPHSWKYNANNVLLDGLESWEIPSDKSSIGIKLFRSIILTDIIVKIPLVSEGLGPYFISFYIKPKSFDQYKKIKSLNELKFNFDSTNDNRYLKKFIKINEYTLDTTKKIHHIKTPITIINLRIPSRDIYVEITSPKGPISLTSIKVYGISELSATQYADDLELLLSKVATDTSDSFSSESENFNYGQTIYNHITLGEDELV